MVIALLATLAVLGHRLMSTGTAISAQNGWDDAHATFYGGREGAETMRIFLFIEII